MDIGSKIVLNNGIEMPWFGLGVFRSEEGGEVGNAVAVALENGYRSIDTASFYRNEQGVGNAVKKSDIPGLKELPEYFSKYPGRIPKDSSEIKERKVSFPGLAWHEENDLALVTVLSQDNKDRWIMLPDPADGHLETLDRQRDEAWIGGPGISGWGMSPGGLGWMPDGKSVWFHSEESGYSHLYTVYRAQQLDR